MMNFFYTQTRSAEIKSEVFENRSAAYIGVREQRKRKKQSGLIQQSRVL